MTTYERIQELSKERGLSVRELGRKLDIGETTIYKWKTQTPKLDVLEKVADFFDASVDYLVGRTDKKLPFDRWERMYGDSIREESAIYHVDKKTSDLAKDDVAFTFEGKKIPKEDLALIREIIKRIRKD